MWGNGLPKHTKATVSAQYQELGFVSDDMQDNYLDLRGIQGYDMDMLMCCTRLIA